MKFRKDLIIITGATGVGKTESSEFIAKQIGGEIINVDIGQFYKPLSIGTAKPDLSSVGVPHHLFDIICEPRNLSIAEYNRLVRAKIIELWSKNRVPILVGGSGFYIYSLLFDPKSCNPTQDARQHDSAPVTCDNSWQELNILDPERAAKIHPNDTYRINRAIEIIKTSGCKSSDFEQNNINIFFDNLYIFILERDRQILYDRINLRTDIMLSGGWIDEVQNLTGEWRDFLKSKKIIGYDDIIKYLSDPSIHYSFLTKMNNTQDERAPIRYSVYATALPGTQNGQDRVDASATTNNSRDNIQALELLSSTIKKRTRNYAKRQITFFKYLEKRIVANWPQDSSAKCEIFRLNMDNENFSLCISELLDKIR